MPIFYYSATFDESLAMLRELCDQGFRVIADRTFDEPAAPQCSHVTDELVELLREGPGFDLAGEFTRVPVQFIQLEGGPANGKFVIDELTQGPVLEGMLARQNVVDGVPTLLLGYLSHQRQYKNPKTGQWEDASAELKAGYRRATATMKKHLVSDPLARCPIGPDALRLVQQGKARLQQHFTG